MNVKKYRKGIVAALTAALTIYGVLNSGGQLNVDDAATMLVSVLGAFGVYAIPNHHESTDGVHATKENGNGN
jgi:hypothetical protein